MSFIQICQHNPILINLPSSSNVLNVSGLPYHTLLSAVLGTFVAQLTFCVNCMVSILINLLCWYMLKDETMRFLFMCGSLFFDV
jgi:hypothetical protein